MNAAINWLRNRGGYYSAHEISRAIGRLKPDTQKLLDSGVKSGTLETREYAFDYIDKSGGSYERIEGEPYTQYRVKADAA